MTWRKFFIWVGENDYLVLDISIVVAIVLFWLLLYGIS